MSERQPSASVQAAEELLDLAMGEANEARREDVQARLHATRRLLHDTRLRVQVAGGHRQGKSALIEALMMSAREDARPAGGFASRLDLVEVPAVGATVTPQQAHVVLFVSDSAAPLTGAELARLRAAVEGCPMTVFVQTKIDACAGWRDVLNRNIALMRDAGLSVETWVVSSVGRLRGGWTGDERLTVGSGLPALVGQLQMLWTDSEVTGLRIVSHHLLAVITELDGMVRQRRAELAEPAVGEDLAARIAELDARQMDLRERAVRWPPLLANGFAKIHADTAFDLRVRVERVRTQLDRTLGDRRPFENWRPMARWLRHRLTLDAKANDEKALDASNEFAAAAAEHFGLPRPAPEPPAEDGAESSIPKPPKPDRGDQKVITLSASVNVLMRSWMGFMMYFLIDGIAQLGALPARRHRARRRAGPDRRHRGAQAVHRSRAVAGGDDPAQVRRRRGRSRPPTTPVSGCDGSSSRCASTTAATSTGATPSCAGSAARSSCAPRSWRPGPRSSRRSTQACTITTRCAIASAPWWPPICSRPPNQPSRDPARRAEPGAFRVGFSPARVGG